MKKTFAGACVLGLFALSAQTFAQSQMAPTGSDQDSFNGWMGGYATKNNGRVTRQAYMDEAGKRWDSMDKDRKGLTTDQINRMYGHGNTPINSVESAPGRAGNNSNKGG